MVAPAFEPGLCQGSQKGGFTPGLYAQTHRETGPLLAQSGHAELQCTCPLLGAKQTSRLHRKMSANDPKRTFGSKGHVTRFSKRSLLRVQLGHEHLDGPGPATS